MDTFNLYWVKVMGQEKHGSPVLPFYHLKSEGFWHLVAKPGMEDVLKAAGPIRSFRGMSELVLTLNRVSAHRCANVQSHLRYVWHSSGYTGRSHGGCSGAHRAVER